MPKRFVRYTVLMALYVQFSLPAKIYQALSQVDAEVSPSRQAKKIIHAWFDSPLFKDDLSPIVGKREIPITDWRADMRRKGAPGKTR